MFKQIFDSSAVPFITPCKSADSKCIKDNLAVAIPIFAKGIPELGVKTLDPLVLKKVDASIAGLKLVATNVSLEGLGKCIPKKAS